MLFITLLTVAPSAALVSTNFAARAAPRVALRAVALPPPAAVATVLRGGATAAALPSVPALAVAALLPTCLGFWKTGYAVSYGYGGAIALSALLTLGADGGLSALASTHALAMVFYGVRLCLFLLYRELILPEKYNQMLSRDATLKERLKRAPVIVGCSLLYFCMAAPLRVTALAAAAPQSATTAVKLAFAGFGLAAVGDAYKSIVKKRKGADYLVTGGPFAVLRHPNYTGELFGWTASTAAALLAGGASAPWLVAVALGWVGILFVLAGEATAGLEKKQKEKYGGDARYEAWVKRTWAGPMLNIGMA